MEVVNRRNRVTAEQRFMAKVVKDESGCWIWNGCKDGEPRNGGDKRGRYGKFALDGYHMTGAHRASYILFVGVIPKNLFVCHRCDIPSCVNPEHLFLGTVKDNSDDLVKKGLAPHQQPGYVSPRTGTGEGRCIKGKGCVVDAVCKNCQSPTLQRVTARRKGKNAFCSRSCKAKFENRLRRESVKI